MIKKSQLGSKVWFSVWIEGLECSTPIDTLPEAIQWVSVMSGVESLTLLSHGPDFVEVKLKG